MDAAPVYRIISLVPDRVARSQSGTLFDGKSSDRAELLTRFLGWLGPLNPIGKEEQQALGLRGGAPRPLADEDDGLGAEDSMGADEPEEPSARQAQAGTPIAV